MRVRIFDHSAQKFWKCLKYPKKGKTKKEEEKTPKTLPSRSILKQLLYAIRMHTQQVKQSTRINELKAFSKQ